LPVGVLGDITVGGDMTFSAKAVANFFLDLAEASGTTLSPMKLQKLVYFAHGWHLAILGTPLIDEQVEAWKFGPVIRTLYHEFKSCGNQAIQSRAVSYKLLPGNGCKIETTRPTIHKTDDTKPSRDLLQKVWDIYSKYSAIQLSNLTHQDGTPWKQTMDMNSGQPPKGTDIPQDIIKRYFQDLARGNG
jgi:uncharacterized phage-associated protein